MKLVVMIAIVLMNLFVSASANDTGATILDTQAYQLYQVNDHGYAPIDKVTLIKAASEPEKIMSYEEKDNLYWRLLYPAIEFSKYKYTPPDFPVSRRAGDFYINQTCADTDQVIDLDIFRDCNFNQETNYDVVLLDPKDCKGTKIYILDKRGRSFDDVWITNRHRDHKCEDSQLIYYNLYFGNSENVSKCVFVSDGVNWLQK